MQHTFGPPAAWPSSDAGHAPLSKGPEATKSMAGQQGRRLAAATQSGWNSGGPAAPEELNDPDAIRPRPGTPESAECPTAVSTAASPHRVPYTLQPELPSTSEEPRQPARRHGGGRYHLRQNTNPSRRYADFFSD
ncbi:hypothetical protein NDU88_001828 [Pleurodeles waltl]|uniref:Uncharacterized protein n=1 Tax=Pleurodeles waltl TaxID=8319 RepID=A0AAV7MKT6_PLEWA|nr:hypothetical protein NDU88_001828 [Pleurodeles waltl]